VTSKKLIRHRLGTNHPAVSAIELKTKMWVRVI